MQGVLQMCCYIFLPPWPFSFPPPPPGRPPGGGRRRPQDKGWTSALLGSLSWLLSGEDTGRTQAEHKSLSQHCFASCTRADSLKKNKRWMYEMALTLHETVSLLLKPVTSEEGNEHCKDILDGNGGCRCGSAFCKQWACPCCLGSRKGRDFNGFGRMILTLLRTLTQELTGCKKLTRKPPTSHVPNQGHSEIMGENPLGTHGVPGDCIWALDTNICQQLLCPWCFLLLPYLGSWAWFGERRLPRFTEHPSAWNSSTLMISISPYYLPSG